MLNPNQKKFFDLEKNVKEYIEACEGIDGRFLIEILKKYLKPNATVLEIGIGAGKDLDILSQTYQTTGSDNSQIFLDIYKQKNPDADLILLDAVTLNTDRKFDCIYSNKVLHHLSKQDFKKSVKLQKGLLNNNGILFHTFWLGEKEAKYQDLNFIQYKINNLQDLFEKEFRLIKIDTYQEMTINDSIYLIFKVD